MAGLPPTTQVFSAKSNLAQTPSQEGRKQLPSIPDTETQNVNCSRQQQSNGTKANGIKQGHGQFLQEYTLTAEYTLLVKEKLPGLYVIPSGRTAFVWNGVLFVRQGIYQHGIFRFTLHIPENYPASDCPKLFFQPPIFHPTINPETGEVDLKRAFPKWRKSVHHIWQVLMYVRRIFYKIDSKSPWNPEAAILYEQEMELYKSKVAETIKLCKEKLLENPEPTDPHAIVFDQWEPDRYEETRKKLLSPRVNSDKDTFRNSSESGLSWIKSGTTQIFSIDDTASG